MASIRRALSPVPRPGTPRGGEAISVASPLSKCSSCNQNYPPPGGFLSSSVALVDYAFYKVQAFVLSMISQRSSRLLERQKLKGHAWRRSVFHFFICFTLGIFVGFTPFLSITLTTSPMSKHQAFFVPAFEDKSSNLSSKVEGRMLNDNAPLTPTVVNRNQENRTRNDIAPPAFQVSEDAYSKLLIIVTPTYSRTFQAYYLNRMAHTLKLVPPPLLWIVVEMTSQSAETAHILRNSGVIYRHLVCTKNTSEIKDRRVHQRNAALSHIEAHHLDGIVYFADDVNFFSNALFEYMRKIRWFGTWPVAKLSQSQRQAMEGPICNGTQVIGWHTDDHMRRFRRFHAEISGFAFNSTILWDPKRWNRPTTKLIRQLDTVKEGLQVSTFIEQILEDETEMEGIPSDCTKVLVWHLHIESSFSHPWEWVVKDNLNAIVPLAPKS